MQRNSSISKKKVGTIQGVHKIRAGLDYWNPKTARHTEFSHSVTSYLSDYKTAHGIEGKKLSKWADEQHQEGLSEMTTSFLDRDGRGKHFWPDDKSSRYYSKYQYSKDHLRIKRAMKELFFKMNQGRKKSKPDLAPAETRRGNSAEEPIEVDSAPNTTATPGDPEPREHFSDAHSSVPRTTPSTDEELGLWAQGVFSEFHGETSGQNRGATTNDPYDGPNSPLESGSLQSRGKRPARPDIEGTSRSKRSKPSTSYQANLSRGNGGPAASTDPDPFKNHAPFAPMEDPNDDDFAPSESDELIESLEFDVLQAQDSRPMAPPPVPVRAMPRQDTTETVGRQSRDVPSRISRSTGVDIAVNPLPGRDAVLATTESPLSSPTILSSPQHSTARRHRAVHTPGPEVIYPDSVDTEYDPDLYREREPALRNNIEPTLRREQPTQAGFVHQPAIVRRTRFETPFPSFNINPKINLSFCVRTSSSLYAECDLQDTYEQKSFQELVDELAGGLLLGEDFNGLRLELENPYGPNFENKISFGDETKFNKVRARFKGKINRFKLSRQKLNNAFEIMIDPLRDGTRFF